MLSYVVILALFVPALVSARTEGIRQCTGGRPFINEVRILNCTQTPCDVFQGSSAIMELDFRTPVQTNSLRPQVFATALGATIEYILPPHKQEACDHLAIGSCPMSANEDATYLFDFPITSAYPPIPVSVELTMWSHGNSHIFCAVIDIHVRLR